MAKRIQIVYVCFLIVISIMQIGCNQKQMSNEVSIEMLNKDLVAEDKMPESNSSDSKTVTRVYTHEECDQILEKIIRESEFNVSYLKNHIYGYVIIQDRIEDGKAFLQLKKKDEKNNYIPDGWFELDLEKEALYLHSDNSEKEVKFKKELLKEYKNNCMQFSDE